MRNEGVKKMSIKVSNLDDEMRKYDISANVWVNEEGNIENIEDGSVLRNGMIVATFSRYATNSHKTFINLSLNEEQVAGEEIRKFIDGAASLATGVTLN